MSSKNTFLKGAVVLVAANFIVKFIGVIYKIPLGNLIGGEGMGYFSAAFEIYQMLLAFSTAGLPVAVSKMVSESHALGRYSEVNKIFKVSLMTFVGVGFFGSLLMFFGAGFFAQITEMPAAQLSIMALAPAVFFFSIIAIFRGYFQGLQNMNPTAISQIIEAVCKLIVGIGLTMLAMSLGKSAQVLSATAILGTTLSTVMAAFLVIFIYKNKSNQSKVREMASLGGECRTSREIISDLIKIVVPVTLGALVVNLTGFLDLFLIMNRMIASGVSDSVAQFAYGSYKGYAYTLFNLPPSIIASVNVTLIPVISAAFAVSDTEKLQSIINKSLKIIIMFALPCAVGLMVLPEQILLLLYPSKLAEVAIATPLLRSLGFATIWTTLASLTTAMLQASGKVNAPIISIAVGGAIKLILNYILVYNFGIIGATISTNACYLVIMAMNIYAIKKHTKTKLSLFSAFGKPLIACGVMAVFAVGTNYMLGSVIGIGASISTILAICIAGVSYFVMILAVKALSSEDLALIPFGNKLARFFNA